MGRDSNNNSEDQPLVLLESLADFCARVRGSTCFEGVSVAFSVRCLS